MPVHLCNSLQQFRFNNCTFLLFFLFYARFFSFNQRKTTQSVLVYEISSLIFRFNAFIAQQIMVSDKNLIRADEVCFYVSSFKNLVTFQGFFFMSSTFIKPDII